MSTRAHYIIIALASAVFALPLLHIGVQGHDAITHLLLSNLIADHALQGDIFPRWLMEMNAGLGSPVLYHYPVIGHYFGILFYPLRMLEHYFQYPAGWLPLVGSAWLGIMLSGISLYTYARFLTHDGKLALLAALLYITAPYHLAVDLYVRIAFSEFWAFVWIPLLFYYTDKLLLTRRVQDGCGIALMLGLLIITHSWTTIFVLGAWVFYAGMQLARSKDYAQGKYLFLFLVLGIGLSAFYLLPAYGYQPLITVQITQGIYHYSKHFLFGADASATTQYIGAVALITTLIGVVGFLQSARSRSQYAWFLITITGFLLTTATSKPLWDAGAFILNKVSFPWRILSVLSFAVTLMLLGWMQRRQHYAIGLACIAINIILCLPGIFIENPESPATYLENKVLTVDDFRTRWTPQQLFTGGTDQIMPQKLAALSKEFKGKNATGHFTGYEEQQWGRNELRFNIKLPKTTRLRLHQFYFPHWKAYANGKRVALLPEPKTGLMILLLPRGEHEVTIRIERGALETMGIIISLLSLAILAGIYRRATFSRAASSLR